MTRLVRVDEEVARFAFEVHLRERTSSWFIVFTNPTAGPWKRIMAPDSEGEWGEVHRFERESLRPDLVLVSDEMQLVLIIEAKDNLAKLGVSKQAQSSITAAASVARTLRNSGANPYWGERSSYWHIFGILWGSTESEREAAVQNTLQLYLEKLGPLKDLLKRTTFGIECLEEEGFLTCHGRPLTEGSTDPDVPLKSLYSSLSL